MKSLFSVSLFFVFILLLIFSCDDRTFSKSSKGKKAHDKYCGSCHSLSSPSDLPKDIWENNVLPEMGARMGIKTEGYDPTKGYSLEDKYRAGLANIYPPTASISEKDWSLIKDYILDNSPDTLEKIPSRALVNKPLQLFSDTSFAIDQIPGGYVTSLEYEKGNLELYIGNAMGHIYSMTSDLSLQDINKLNSPVIHNVKANDQLFITEIGIINPSEVPAGKIWKLNSTESNPQIVLDGLHRPVFTYLHDFNSDEELDIVTCEFGHFTGQLNVYMSSEKGYKKQTILNQPGVLKVEWTDMDNNGTNELVAIASQGNEGVYIFEYDTDSGFTEYNPIRSNPVHGSSWMSIADMDTDGYKDIILVNGDNADYSVTPKPYHGLRIYMNDGQNQFTENYFYPINGATRVISDDFDKDGDIDIGVTAFFPDYENNPSESFLYLENMGKEEFVFTPRTFKNSDKGRWLLMESGDFDQDGDTDIMLGSCIQGTVPTPEEFTKKWNSSNVDLVLLENKLN